MQADIDGALRIVRAAGAFDWTWTEGDLTRFCDRVGWRVTASGADHASIQTDLQVSAPRAHAFLDRGTIQRMALAGKAIKWIDVWVSDLADDEEEDGSDEHRADLARTFAQLHDRLGIEMGSADEKEFDEDLGYEVRWTERPAVITLALNAQAVSLSITNPLYREWANEGDE
ncbi:DUF6301 family protein [Nocardia sp. NPDC050406]|uniref:DUF6301 family protein n=1 Tax=Nocardia sp. NPDC050406 TaxID=3364318 RepID=UPI0037A8E3F7